MGKSCWDLVSFAVSSGSESRSDAVQLRFSSSLLALCTETVTHARSSELLQQVLLVRVTPELSSSLTVTGSRCTSRGIHGGLPRKLESRTRSVPQVYVTRGVHQPSLHRRDIMMRADGNGSSYLPESSRRQHKPVRAREATPCHGGSSGS